MGIGKRIRSIFSIKTTNDFIDECLLSLFNNKKRKIKTIDLGCGKGTYLICSTHNQYIENCDLVDKFDLPYKEILNDDRTVFYSENLLSYFDSVKSESIDFILAKDVLEHLTYEESIILLKESYRSLSKGGVLLVQVPNGSSPFGMRNFNNDLTHIQFLGHKSLKSLSRMVFKNNVEVYPVDEFLSGKIYFLSGIIQKLLLQPLLQFILSSSIHDTGRYFWSLNIISINKK